MGRLQGKVSVITGAASGIGRGSAERFAEEGATVVVTDVRLEGAEAVADAICKAGGKAIALKVDISSQDDIRAMIDKTIAEFGRIDTLFNNALFMSPATVGKDNDFLNYDPAIFTLLMNGNVLGAVLAAKFAIPHMLAQGGGSIIFTSSISSLGGDVIAYTYGASKAAINVFAQSIAVTFGKQGVRSNVILPGTIQTAATAGWMTPAMNDGFMSLLSSPRMGLPEDVANMALFLASDESKYINGGLFPVDGGISATVPQIPVTRMILEGRAK